MRLALVYHQFLPSIGGLERYLFDFASRLIEAGHELELVTSECSAEAAALAVRMHKVWRPPSKLWQLSHFARRSAEIVSSIKVDATLGFGLTWRQDIHRAGGGCHAEFNRSLSPHKQSSWKNQLALSLERKLYTSGQTRTFVVNSERVKKELQEHYQLDGAKVRIIRTAVDTSNFHPAANAGARAAIREKMGLPADEPALLFVSAADFRRKGLACALRAMPALPEAALWIAGPPLDREHVELAARLGVQHRIRPLGVRSDLPLIYRAADVFLHPTQYDACANTALQSLASGLPSIISANDGASEFVIHGENGYILRDPNSHEELANLAKTALSLTAENRAAMSSRAATAMHPLTWDAHLAGWMELILQLRQTGQS